MSGARPDWPDWADWYDEHRETIVSALSILALVSADPGPAIRALEATNPAVDWSGWIEDMARMRYRVRDARAAIGGDKGGL